jgi:heptosyltransferase-2
MKILIIQTAFIGDVVLATALVEKLHEHHPHAQIDFLLRKGNESLLTNNPHVHEVIIFDKKQGKYQNLSKLVIGIRKRRYDYVINVQRFAAAGIMAALSGAKHRIGFSKSPLSFLYTKRIQHVISETGTQHEIERNHALIRGLTDDMPAKPKLYPSGDDFKKINAVTPYITVSPASVWFTKQYPKEQWIDFVNNVPNGITIYLLGGKTDIVLCEDIRQSTTGSRQSAIQNLAGQLSFLESAALMKGAVMNYVNDSAPLHFASAMNAPVTAVFCSTVPAFGFGPLSEVSYVVETDIPLSCRPCGLHGFVACPLGHFNCSVIEKDKLLATLPLLQ